MKKLFILCLTVAFVSVLFAAQTTSYNPNEPIKANESIAKEIKANLARNGNLTSYESQAIEDYQNSTTKKYVAHLGYTRSDTVVVSPQNVNYWTGSTDGTTKTDISLVNGYNTEDGWFMFDISGIPLGSSIDSVEFNGYVNSTNYPYWSLTPVTSDPLTATAADLYADINAEATTSADCYAYQNEGSTYAVGWKVHMLGSTVNTDVAAAMANGWFATGMAARDNSTTYFVNFDGWAQTNPPFLNIYYTPPVDGPNVQSGAVSPESGNQTTTFDFSVLYSHTGGTAPVSATLYTRPNGLAAWTSNSLVYPAGTPDYTLWQTFTYSTTLAVGTTWQYYFEFDDGVADAVVVDPATAPALPYSGPNVYTALTGNYGINGAGGHQWTTFQDCFDDLHTIGTDGSTINISVYDDGGNYVENATLLSVPGTNASGWVNFYPATGEVVTIETPATLTGNGCIAVDGASYLTFDGFNFIGSSSLNAAVRLDYATNVEIAHCDINPGGYLGIGIVSSSDVKVYNNFLSDVTSQCIALYDNGTGCNIEILNNSIYSELADIGMTFSVSEASVYNNVIYLSKLAARSVMYAQNQDWTSHPNTLFNYNNYYQTGGATILEIFGVISYTTLPLWQAAPEGQDAQSVEGDPMFVHKSVGELHITTNCSPSFQAGTTLASVTDDIDGDLRSLMPLYDIGADVIVTECSPPYEQVTNLVTQSGADLGWTGCGSNYDLYIVLAGSPAPIPTDTPTIDDTNTNPYTWTGGATSTTYDWYVRSDCGSDNVDVSSWFGVDSLVTQDACPIPTGLAVSNLTPTSATLDWDVMVSATGYNWEIVLRDSAQGVSVVDNGATVGGGINTASSTLLLEDTEYDYRVQTICGLGVSSDWSGPFPFATPVSPIYPLMEDFEAALTIPDYWQSDMSVSATHGETTNGLYRNLYSSVPTTYAITRPVGPLTGISQLVFDYRIVNWSGYPATATPITLADDFTISISNDGGTNYTALTVIDSANHVVSTDFAPVTIDLSAYSGDNVLIQFDMVWAAGDFYLDIDNVLVQETPSCLMPTVLTETLITSLGATLGWTSAETYFDVYIVPTGDPAPIAATTPTADDVNALTYLWAGGSQASTYDWYVRADCAAGGGTGQSDWEGPSTFTTLCDDITAYPYTEDFDGTWSGTPASPTCWTVIDNDADGQTWIQDNQYITPTHSEPYAAHGAGNNDDYLITPALDLLDNSEIRWWDVVESASYNNTYDVWVSTTTDDISAFTDSLGTYDCINTAWTEHILDLTAYNGQTIYVAFYQTYSAATYYGFGIDDVTVQEIPSVPIFDSNPDTMDFGSVYVTFSTAPQTFTFANIGVGTINVSSVSITGTDAAEFTLVDTNSVYPIALTTNTMDVTVAFNPTSAGVKNAFLTVVDDLASRATRNIPLTGEGTTPPQGDVISNPFVVGALPYNVTGSTVGFQNNYGYGLEADLVNLLCTDVSYFGASTLGSSADVVYEITLASPTQLIIDLCASGYDTAVALVSGDGLDDVDVLLVDDDSELDGALGGCAACCQSYINCGVQVPAGTYYIIVGGYSSNEGDYDLTVSVAPVVTVPTNVVIVNDGTNVTITWDAVVDATGYRVYSSTDAYGMTPVFAEDVTGVFTAEQWVAPNPAANTFYYVTAYVGSSDNSGYTPVLTSEEIRKQQIQENLERSPRSNRARK